MSRASLRGPPAQRPDLMFNPWLTCTAARVVKLTDDLMLRYEEGAAATRKRKLKARDRDNLRTVLHALIANAALALACHIEPPEFAISMRAAKRKVTRYERPGFTAVPAVIAWLEASGVLTFSPSRRYRVASVLSPTTETARLLEGIAWSREHFKETPGGETILLSRRIDKNYITGDAAREWRAYPDHPDADRYRAEVATINAALAKAPVSLLPDSGPRVLTIVPRSLCRYFHFRDGDPDRFDLGGRLYGGWWQSLAANRRKHIRIDGEPIADLDFSNMALRLAYCEVGVQPPEGDLYGNVPGLTEPRWRSGVKMLALALLFRDTPLVRLPVDARAMFPADASAQSVRTAIFAAHPALSAVFERGVGFKLMFVESQILVAALLKLVACGVAALPMHDGLMVATSKVNAARQAMSAAALEITGYQLPIIRKL